MLVVHTPTTLYALNDKTGAIRWSFTDINGNKVWHEASCGRLGASARFVGFELTGGNKVYDLFTMAPISGGQGGPSQA